MTPETARPTARLPLVIYVLAAGVFLMSTTELVMAGMLPGIAESFGIGVGEASLGITVFAIGMIVGSPLMAILTLRLPRRLALALALLLFSFGHVLAATAPAFGVLLAARFVTAFATGAFWAVTAIVVVKAAGRAAPRALGIVLGGGMLANVVGVPLGAFAAQAIGWRVPFWVLAVVALAGAVVMYRRVPVDPPAAHVPSVRAEFRSLKDVRVWLVYASAAIVCGSCLAAYSFISPLLTESTGLPASAVPLVLMVYGVGALVGANLGGHLGAHRPYAVMFVAAIMMFLVLVALALFSHTAAVAVPLLGLLGLFGTATNPLLIGKAVHYANHATLAAALSTSSFNVGIAVGTSLAGFALGTGLGTTGPVVVGAAIAALYVVPLTILRRKDRAEAARQGAAADTVVVSTMTGALVVPTTTTAIPVATMTTAIAVPAMTSAIPAPPLTSAIGLPDPADTIVAATMTGAIALPRLADLPADR